MVRSDVNSPTYLEVKDSATLQEFGKRNLSNPGSKSKLDSREFIDLLPAEVISRKQDRPDSKTIAGISTKFQYVCKVINIIILIVLLVTLYRWMELCGGVAILASVSPVLNKTGKSALKRTL